MPQMFPLMWLTLFLMSAITLLLVMTILYFSTNLLKNEKKFKIKMEENAWKW